MRNRENVTKVAKFRTGKMTESSKRERESSKRERESSMGYI